MICFLIFLIFVAIIKSQFQYTLKDVYDIHIAFQLYVGKNEYGYIIIVMNNEIELYNKIISRYCWRLGINNEYAIIIQSRVKAMINNESTNPKIYCNLDNASCIESLHIALSNRPKDLITPYEDYLLLMLNNFVCNDIDKLKLFIQLLLELECTNIQASYTLKYSILPTIKYMKESTYNSHQSIHNTRCNNYSNIDFSPGVRVPCNTKYWIQGYWYIFPSNSIYINRNNTDNYINDDIIIRCNNNNTATTIDYFQYSNIINKDANFYIQCPLLFHINNNNNIILSVKMGIQRIYFYLVNGTVKYIYLILI